MNDTGTSGIADPVSRLIQKGVRIPKPATVYIDSDVDTARISGTGTIIYPGCRIFGRKTLICDHVQLGREQPATIEDCYIGPHAALKGGYYRHSVFLQKAAAGSGAHIREGCILEEGASAAHTVGLKQTILFPFVTLGSLINFCDCLMAGGTGPKNHSEVGSSFIHFNFTANQDKATPSLFGDVPGGVMLNRPPIFLGGQGGVVGPCRLAYGTVTAAGSITRKDQSREGMLIFEGGRKGGAIPFSTTVYHSIHRVLVNNILYIGNLYALRQWYRHVRSLFTGHEFSQNMQEGLEWVLQLAIDERIKRLAAFRDKVSLSVDTLRSSGKDAGVSFVQQEEFRKSWPSVRDYLLSCEEQEGDLGMRDAFLDPVSSAASDGSEYVAAIQGLPAAATVTGTRWLQSIIDRISAETDTLLPSFNIATVPGTE